VENVLSVVTWKTNIVLRFEGLKRALRKRGCRLVAMGAAPENFVSRVDATQAE
tara:strand:+ start:270 stop:428 length:159 start_codon:yes stop_codon:yes gene_type:complete